MRYKLFLIYVFGLLIVGCQDKDQQDYNTQYFRDYHVNFSGVVSEKHYIANSGSLGMLLLDDLVSLPEDYYPLDSLDYFYFASRKKRGVLIENILHKIEIGDSLVYNPNEKVLRVLRGDSLVLTEKPWINTHIFAKPNKGIIKTWLNNVKE